MIRVFRTVSKKGDIEHWAIDELEMSKEKRDELSSQGWGIEEYHRGIKQCCGIERAQVRKARSILNHIHMSIRAFSRLELYRLMTGVSWYEAKVMIIREVRTYPATPDLCSEPKCVTPNLMYLMKIVVYRSCVAIGGCCFPPPLVGN